jgi:hypothetical protein
MLAAVLTMFLVFTVSGVAVLNLSSYTALEHQDAVQSLKNQYEVESAVNVAMWRINSDSEDIEWESGPVSVALDTTTKDLVVSIDRYDKTYQVNMDLREDFHFNHAIATSDSMISNGYTAVVASGKEHRKFSFLPDEDLQYYLDNAVETHSESWHAFEGDTLANGIHVFTGNFITLENMKLFGTVVFTGRYITFLGGNEFEAPADANNSQAAVVFTNENENIAFTDDEIKGPVFGRNRVKVHNGAKLSGPVVARVVELKANIDFLDTENPQYYKWNNGFGNYSDYEWPMHIGAWRATYSD